MPFENTLPFATSLVAHSLQILLTVSAMKMEVHVKAPFDGKLGKLHVAQGDKIVEGALLAEIV